MASRTPTRALTIGGGIVAFRRPTARALAVLVITAGTLMAASPSLSPTQPAVHASALAGMSGSPVTGIQAVNGESAGGGVSVSADFYRKGCGAPTTVSATMPPSGAALYYLPNIPQLSSGAYSVILTGAKPIKAIASTIWPSTGAGASIGNPRPSTDVVLPLVLSNYQNSSSQIAIQNSSPSQVVSARVEWFELGSPDPTRTQNYTLCAGGSVVLDMAGADATPKSYIGWLHVTAPIPVAVQSMVDIRTQARAVYGFEGVPGSMAADTLFVPLTRNNFSGTTGISVVNPSAKLAMVTVEYKGSPATPVCAGKTFAEGPFSIVPSGGRLFYQGFGPLPSGCLASAVIRAAGGGKILAVVNDANQKAGTSAAYNAFSAAETATRLVLPLYRNGQLPNRQRLTTGIQAMNVGAAAANVTLSVKNNVGADIPCGACTVRIAPGDAYTWYPPTTVGLRDRRDVYGSAAISSDQPLAVIVNDASEPGAPTPYDSQIYAGVAVGDSLTAAIPLAWKN